MAQLTVQNSSIDGLSATYDSADVAGDSFLNDGQVVLHVKNGDTSSHTVTLNVQKAIEYGTLTDPTVTVAAGDDEFIGPFDREWFNDSDKLVQVDYDAVTSVTVAAIKV